MATVPRDVERRARRLLSAASAAANLKQHFEVLVGEMTPELIAAYKARGLEVAQRLKVEARVDEIIDHEAAKYAKQRGGELIKLGFANTTQDMLQATLEQSIMERESAGALREKLFEDYAFSPTRALAIARTETGIAQRAGSMVSARAAGAEEKSWSADLGACILCLSNAEQGWIAMDADFTEGDSPHVNCRCSIDFRMAEQNSAETEAEEGAISE